MKYIIELPDDFKPGDCHDYTNGTSCPFGARGCYAKDKSKCPMSKAEVAVQVPTPCGHEFRAMFERKNGEKDADWNNVTLYAVEKGDK